MCKEMAVILINTVVDTKRIIGKMEGRAGGEAQWVIDLKKSILQGTCSIRDYPLKGLFLSLFGFPRLPFIFCTFPLDFFY
jgi:hypothetical protein